MTPLQLRDADHRLVRERFSVVIERMVLELRGVACIGLEEVAPDRKSLIASRSFGQAVETRAALEEAVSVYTARAAEKMRRQNLATASIAVWIQTNSFKPQERQYNASKAVRLPVATADTGKLLGRRWPDSGSSSSRATATKRPASPSLISWRPARCKAACSIVPTMRVRSAACAPLTNSTNASGAARLASARRRAPWVGIAA